MSMFGIPPLQKKNHLLFTFSTESIPSASERWKHRGWGSAAAGGVVCVEGGLLDGMCFFLFVFVWRFLSTSRMSRLGLEVIFVRIVS